MPKKFCFISVLWGKEFIKTWLDTCLGFQVEMLKQFSSDDLFAIYTPQANEHWTPEFLNQLSAIYRDTPPKLALHPVNFSRPDSNYHHMMANCHRQAMADHAGPDTVIVFLSPDVVYSQNAFPYMKQKIEDGYKAVLVPMFRVLRHKMVEEIASYRQAKEAFDQGSLAHQISPRQLLSRALPHQHPMTKALFWDANPFCGGWPSHLYFKAPYGIIGHCWHQHPMAICLDKAVSPDGTIDADLLIKAGIHREEISIATDSDDFCAVEMTDAASHNPAPGYRASAEALAAWGKRYCSELDHWYFQHRVRWHALDVTNWDESQADEVMGKINEHLDNTIIKTPFDVHFTS